MKKVCWLVALSLSVLLCGCRCGQAESVKSAEPVPPETAKKNMERVCAFLKATKVYYIATVDGDQPRVRPFGTVNIFDGKLYIQTGRKKNVAKQILANGKVELCSFNGKEWLRLSGTLVEDPRIEAQMSMLTAYPGLKKMYLPGDGNTLVLYFRDAEATFNTFGKPSETIRF